MRTVTWRKSSREEMGKSFERRAIQPGDNWCWSGTQNHADGSSAPLCGQRLPACQQTPCFCSTPRSSVSKVGLAAVLAVVTGLMSPGTGQPAARRHGKLLNACADAGGQQPLGFPVQTQAHHPAESQDERQSIPRMRKRGEKKKKPETRLGVVSAGVLWRKRIHHPRQHTGFGKNRPCSLGTSTKSPRVCG